MYNDFYNTNYTTGFDLTWPIVSIVLAIVGGIAIYFVFVANKNKGEYDGFLEWLHNFLNFKTFFIEPILKILYITVAIFLTLISFAFIKVSVTAFFMVLLFGNLAARIGYELMFLVITLVSNTTEINKKLSYLAKEKESTNKTKKKAE